MTESSLTGLQRYMASLKAKRARVLPPPTRIPSLTAPGQFPRMPEALRRTHLAQLIRLIMACHEAGVASEPLQRVLDGIEGVDAYEGSDGCWWVRVRMGGYIVVDGPFGDEASARSSGETISRRDVTR